MLKKPILVIKEIADIVLRENFKKLQDYFDEENQLLGFKFLQIIQSTNEANLKIRHGLTFVPKDIILTRLIAPSAARLVINWGLCDDTYLDITVSGLATNETLNARLFVGTYRDDSDTTPINSTDTQELRH